MMEHSNKTGLRLNITLTRHNKYDIITCFMFSSAVEQMVQEKEDDSSSDGSPQYHSDEIWVDDSESQSHSSEERGRNLEVYTILFHHQNQHRKKPFM